MTVGLNNNKLTGGLPEELSRFKKLQIDVQGKKLSNLAEELLKIKRWNGRLVVTFGCDAILCPRNNFSDKGRRENVDEKCQTCPNGNSSKNFGQNWCNTNAVTDYSEASSDPTVSSDAPSQYNKIKESRSRPKQVEIRGGIWVATKALIIMVGLAVPIIILYYLWGTYVCIKESKEYIKYSIWIDPVWCLTLNLWIR